MVKRLERHELEKTCRCLNHPISIQGPGHGVLGVRELTALEEEEEREEREGSALCPGQVERDEWRGGQGHGVRERLNRLHHFNCGKGGPGYGDGKVA